MPPAFDLIRYAGAAYLIYLGVKVLLARGEGRGVPELQADSLRRIFTQGVITNVLNPKVAMFFLAFLPQFVSPARGPVFWRIIVLGLIFDAGGTLVNLGVAQVGGRLGDALRRSPRFARIQKWFTATVFLGLGARIAWQE